MNEERNEVNIKNRKKRFIDIAQPSLSTYYFFLFLFFILCELRASRTCNADLLENPRDNMEIYLYLFDTRYANEFYFILENFGYLWSTVDALFDKTTRTHGEYYCE